MKERLIATTQLCLKRVARQGMNISLAHGMGYCNRAADPAHVVARILKPLDNFKVPYPKSDYIHIL